MSELKENDWFDKWGACKVCGGEIPHGHANDCAYYQREKHIAALEIHMAKDLSLLHELQSQVNRYKTALESIVGQTDDQFVDGVWREVNSTASEALREKKI